MRIVPGSIDQTVDVFIKNSSVTTGAGLPGLVYNSAGLTCYYRRGGTGTPVALPLVTQTVNGAHADGGFVEVDATNAPGLYRLDLSDAIVAVGALYISLFLRGATNMADTFLQVDLETITDDVTEIKAITDQMVFSNANELDANIKSINEAPVIGSGTFADPWEGA